MTGIASPGGDGAYDNTTFFFARPLLAKKENGETL
jgi:hypothetical protein